jgi:hypothetical protein
VVHKLLVQSVRHRIPRGISVTRRNLILHMSFNDTLLDPTLLEADANDFDPVEDPVAPVDDPLDPVDPDGVAAPDPAGDTGEDDEGEEEVADDDEL